MAGKREAAFEAVQKRVDLAANAINADIIAYFGDVNASGASKLCRSIRAWKSRKHVLLMLATYGGDANSAYRVARQIQKVYGTRKDFKDSDDDPQFWCFLPTSCKSAGTIITLGADKLIVSDDSELGPIDPQHRKQDEVGERISGLTPAMALNTLHGSARAAFVEHFSRLRFDPKLLFSTKLAAEMASGMAIELLKPIFEQIDPMRLAEMERSLQIASEYGQRLNVGNLRDGALPKLLSDYPSHSFIIDAAEMKSDLFINVEEAAPELEQVARDFRSIYLSALDKDEPYVFSLSDPPKGDQQQVTNGQGETREAPTTSANGSADAGNSRAPAPAIRRSAAKTAKKDASSAGGG